MIVGVSRRTVYSVEKGIHCPSRKRPVRCADCGCKIASLPCLACMHRQVARPASSFACEAGHLSPLELRGKAKERYLEVRRKVEKEIAEGKRTADSDFYD